MGIVNMVHLLKDKKSLFFYLSGDLVYLLFSGFYFFQLPL